MDQAKLHAIEAHCTQEAMPHCQARCPLRMDVRSFMKHMHNGNMREARKVLERHLPLPEIMARICDHPCEEACLRKDFGGALSVGSLESMCISSVSKQTTQFPRPPKPKQVAVFGNTLAGLVVAFELGRKAWPVTIFYEEDTVAGLIKRFAQLSADIIEMELEALEKNGCTFIKSILDQECFAKTCAEYDVVFVDGDAAPLIYSVIGDITTDFLQAGEKCCAAGFVDNVRSASEQAGDARRAATTLERLLTGVSLSAGRELELARTSPLYTPLQKVESRTRIEPQTLAYTQEEAAEEASRCLLCECMACVKECVYMQKYGGYPKSYARQIYNNASIVKGEHLANKLINGCTLCGQCTEICPGDFNMADLCLLARQDMVKRNYMPPSAHEFALEDMESADASAIFMGDPGKDPAKCEYLFFPGCQLAASRGEQVLAVYEVLRQTLNNSSGVGLGLGCCGIPAHWAGEQDLFTDKLASFKEHWESLDRPTCVLACSSCMQVLKDNASEVPIVSLWQILDKHYIFPESKGDLQSYTIHDPCTARHNVQWQKAVRNLALKCNVKPEEPHLTGTTTECCGYGGLVWNAQPELADNIARHRGASLTHTALASCIMCRDRLVKNGTACLYMLDILPLKNVKPVIAEAPSPTLSGRRAGREALKKAVLNTYMGQDMTLKTYKVQISPELLERLEQRHILREDVEEAVCTLEESKKRFCERSSGHYIGSWKPRNVTFWVRYSIQGTGFILHDAWCHRMVVPNAGGKDADHTSPSLRIRA